MPLAARGQETNEHSLPSPITGERHVQRNILHQSGAAPGPAPLAPSHESRRCPEPTAFTLPKIDLTTTRYSRTRRTWHLFALQLLCEFLEQKATHTTPHGPKTKHRCCDMAEFQARDDATAPRAHPDIANEHALGSSPKTQSRTGTFTDVRPRDRRAGNSPASPTLPRYGMKVLVATADYALVFLKDWPAAPDILTYALPA